MKYTTRILLVEDEHLQREMLRDVLEKEGYIEYQNLFY